MKIKEAKVSFFAFWSFVMITTLAEGINGESLSVLTYMFGFCLAILALFDKD